MSKLEHTPGPWEYIQAQTWPFGCDNDHHICGINAAAKMAIEKATGKSIEEIIG